MIKDIIRLIRPAHWVKNGFVLLPVVFALKVYDVGAWTAALWAALGFSLSSSFMYVINDMKDIQADRLHPRKKDRPLASGTIGTGVASAVAVICLFAGLLVAWRLASLMTAVVILCYVVMQLAYTFGLKRKMVIDVICIAMGFVLRAIAGAVAIKVDISPWLFVCTLTVCMFVGFCKRYSEFVTFADKSQAANHRLTLSGYTPELLTHLVTLSAAVAIVSYLLYASSPRTMEHFGNDYLIYTLPLVIYGICRFAMLSMTGRFGDPMDVLFHDRAFQLTLLLWGLCVLAVVGYGRAIGDYAKWLFQG